MEHGASELMQVRGKSTQVLVVDKDRELVELLGYVLRRAGLTVQAAFDAPTALDLLEACQPSVVVLEPVLGPSTNLGLVRELHARDPHLAILILSTRDSTDEKVAALDLGADDYMTKPFSYRELQARIRGCLRRGGHVAQSVRAGDTRAVVRVGPLLLDTDQHLVTNANQTLSLTLTEFRVLEYLMRRPDTLVSTRELLKHIWGWDDLESKKDVVRVTVHRLRHKLEAGPASARLLETIQGVGFRLTNHQMTARPQAHDVHASVPR